MKIVKFLPISMVLVAFSYAGLSPAEKAPDAPLLAATETTIRTESSSQIDGESPRRHIRIERRGPDGEVQVEERDEDGDVLRRPEMPEGLRERRVRPFPGRPGGILPRPPGGGLFRPQPPFGGLGDPDRHEHLEQAIEHLHAAGMHELAERLEARLNGPAELGGRMRGEQGMHREIEKLKKSHHKLEKKVRKLEKALKKLKSDEDDDHDGCEECEDCDEHGEHDEHEEN